MFRRARQYRKAAESRRKASGFTLVELMIATMILAILASVALPSFGAFQRDNRLDSAAQNLNSSVRLARSEAIAKNSFVRVEIATDQTVTLCRIDAIGDACPGAADEDTFRTVEVSFDGVEIESPDVDLTDGFVFNSRGRLEGGGTLDIGVCDDRGAAEGKIIRINAVGRSNLREISDTADAACS